MVEVVSTRTPLRRASGSRFTGRCPFHEEKTPSFSVNPVDKLYYCFGCGKGGDVVVVRPRDREPRLRRSDRVAGGAVPRPARVRGGVAEAGRGAPAARAALRRARPDRRLLRAAALGRRRRRPGARVPRRPWTRRGGREGVPARALAGSRARGEGEGARILARRAEGRPGSSRPGAATTSRSGSCSRSPTRGAASSGFRRASSATTIRCAGST